jgi:hypothetical protein
MHVLAECEQTGSVFETAGLLLDLRLDVKAVGGEYDTTPIAASFQGSAAFKYLLSGHEADV